MVVNHLILLSFLQWWPPQPITCLQQNLDSASSSPSSIDVMWYCNCINLQSSSEPLACLIPLYSFLSIVLILQSITPHTWSFPPPDSACLHTVHRSDHSWKQTQHQKKYSQSQHKLQKLTVQTAHSCQVFTITPFSRNRKYWRFFLWKINPSTTDHAVNMLLTLKAPRRKRVGSRPTEKMRRRMVIKTSARTPSGWGMMMTMMSVAKTPIHSNADRCGSSITVVGEIRTQGIE